MSFKLFDIEFDGEKDSFEEGSEKMDKVCKLIGKKLLKSWIHYGVKSGCVKDNKVNDVYKMIKVLEEVDFNELSEDLKKELDGN